MRRCASPHRTACACRSANGAIPPARRSCSSPAWRNRSCRSTGRPSSALARDFRIIAYDLRGHGLSDKPTDPACYQDGKRWADELAAVIAAKRLRRPVLVGWSLGGRVLRQYLMHYGDGALSGINFLASRPIEDPSIVGPGVEGDAGATRRATSRAASPRASRSCAPATRSSRTRRTSSRRSPTTSCCRSRSATRSAAGRPIRTLVRKAFAAHHGADAGHAWPARPADPAGSRRDDRGGDQGRDHLVLRRLRPLAVLRGRRALQSRACGVRRRRPGARAVADAAPPPASARAARSRHRRVPRSKHRRAGRRRDRDPVRRHSGALRVPPAAGVVGRARLDPVPLACGARQRARVPPRPRTCA